MIKGNVQPETTIYFVPSFCKIKLPQILPEPDNPYNLSNH